MKKILSLLLAFSLALSLAACGGSASSAASSAAVSEVASSAAASEEEETAAPLSATEPLRIAGLKGPTTMGLVNLLSMEQAGTAAMDYDLQLYGAADEIVPLLIKGELDMAAIPANLAATLYQKTSGGIQAVAVNTLGVLYVVEQGDTVHSTADLKGRTILSTGKGTTPEYVLRYLLTANGLDPDKDVDIQYYSCLLYTSHSSGAGQNPQELAVPVRSKSNRWSIIMNQNSSVRKLVHCGVVAAIYVVLCLALQPLSYGAVQVRVAEALCLLPVFGAEYIVGVVLGCFLANLLGSTIVDVIFGTLATLLACLVTYKLRNVRFKGLAIAASLPPVLFNAVIIGIEIAVMFPDPTSSAPIWLACITNGISVGIGELISCTVLGVVLVKLIESNAALRKVFVTE